jgi:hypothetical protein
MRAENEARQPPAESPADAVRPAAEEGAVRVDLQGKPVMPVSNDQRNEAVRRLAFFARKAADRKASA